MRRHVYEDGGRDQCDMATSQEASNHQKLGLSRSGFSLRTFVGSMAHAGDIWPPEL